MAADRIQAPDLPELERQQIGDGDLNVSGALIEQDVIRAGRVRITESELRGVVRRGARRRRADPGRRRPA